MNILGVTLSFIKLLMTFPIIVSGSSMLPTFYDGDMIFADRFPVIFGEVERGDVVVFNLPYESARAYEGVDVGASDAVEDGRALLDYGDLYVKRVVGAPGDELAIKDGYVYVNDERLKEPYVRRGTKTYGVVAEYPVLTADGGGVKYTVPEDSYFLLGDNRESSVDSRHFILHYVSRADIRGVFTFLKFP